MRWHHEADVGPDAGAEGHAEGEHECHDGDASHKQNVFLGGGIACGGGSAVRLVQVEEHADDGVEEGQRKSADDGHLAQFEVLEHGNGDKGADELRNGDEDGSVQSDSCLVERERNHMAGLGDE